MQLTRHKKADGIRLYTLTGAASEFFELKAWGDANKLAVPVHDVVMRMAPDEPYSVQFAYDFFSEKVMMHLRYLHKKARKAATPSVIDAAGNPMIVETVPGNLYSDIAKLALNDGEELYRVGDAKRHAEASKMAFTAKLDAIAADALKGNYKDLTHLSDEEAVADLSGHYAASGTTKADTLLTGIENDKEKLRKAITAAYAALDKAATAHPVNAEPVVQASFRDAPSITVTPTKPLLSKAQIAVGCIVAAVAVLLIAAVL